MVRGSYVGNQDYIYPHISISGNLCHYFFVWSEQNDALKIAVYIFERASTLDRSSCSVYKPLYGVLVLQNM